MSEPLRCKWCGKPLPVEVEGATDATLRIRCSDRGCLLWTRITFSESLPALA